MQNQSNIPLENVLISTFKRIAGNKVSDVEQQQSMLAKELRKTLYVFFFYVETYDGAIHTSKTQIQDKDQTSTFTKSVCYFGLPISNHG